MTAQGHQKAVKPPRKHNEGISTPRQHHRPERFTLPASAAKLGCSPQTVSRLIEKGEMPGAVNIGTRKKRFYRLSDNDLTEFAARRSAKNE